MFVTFLGRGKANTPAHVDAQVHVKSVGSSATRGEAGAYMEYLTFGGKVTTIRDPAQDDNQVRSFSLLRRRCQRHELIQTLARHPLPYYGGGNLRDLAGDGRWICQMQ